MAKSKKKGREERDKKRKILRKIQKLNRKVERFFEGESRLSSQSTDNDLDRGNVSVRRKYNLPQNALDATCARRNLCSTQPVLDTILTPELGLEPSSSLPGNSLGEPGRDPSVGHESGADLESANLRPSVGLEPGVGREPDVDLESDGGLEPEVLDILGADPSKSRGTQFPLQEEPESRWGHWLSTQLGKEELDQLLDQYSRESDKCNFEAPKQNPEIAAMSPEVLVQRDQKFITLQNTVGSALVALGSAISSLLVDEEIDKLELLRRLCDSGKLLTQVHRGLSTTRRAFVSPGLNKQVRDALEGINPDKFLYGSNLSEKVKEVRVMSKIGQELRPPPKKQTIQRSGNSKGPFVKFKKPQTGFKSRSQYKTASTSRYKQSQQRQESQKAKNQAQPTAAQTTAQKAEK
ncbi:PREDICTED: uncharacterized protein LOC105566387 [Vollenhovia emeryi]|uniref:uncharacterized protein LOC105566387 n=1 Tax=Vollenhovia emeryi TaxID=411798 RepID=UPI0005F37AE2|nr:PREDICTED: uncharacterized protein LOC105566387 [Vollenhovia emeryi]